MCVSAARIANQHKQSAFKQEIRKKKFDERIVENIRVEHYNIQIHMFVEITHKVNKNCVAIIIKYKNKEKK